MIKAKSIETFRYFINQAKESNAPFVILGKETDYPRGGNYANGTCYKYDYLLLCPMYKVRFHGDFAEGEGSYYTDISKLPEYQSVSTLSINTDDEIKCEL